MVIEKPVEPRKEDLEEIAQREKKESSSPDVIPWGQFTPLSSDGNICAWHPGVRYFDKLIDMKIGTYYKLGVNEVMKYETRSFDIE